MPEEIQDVDYEGLENASLGVNMLAGGLAGISEHVFMYPVDSIKVRPPSLPSLSWSAADAMIAR